MQFIPVNQRRISTITKVVALVMGILLILVGLHIDSVYSVVIGGILFIAITFKKTIFLDDRGIVGMYQIGPFKTVDIWLYDEIESVHAESKVNYSFSALHFQKGALSKVLVFPVEVLPKIEKFIKSKNDSIFFGDTC